MTDIAAAVSPSTETAAALPARLAKGVIDRLVIIVPYPRRCETCRRGA